MSNGRVGVLPTISSIQIRDLFQLFVSHIVTGRVLQGAPRVKILMPSRFSACTLLCLICLESIPLLLLKWPSLAICLSQIVGTQEFTIGSTRPPCGTRFAG